MCSHFSLTPTRKCVVDEFNIGVVTELDQLPPVTERFNVSPSQAVAVVVPNERGRMMTAMRWGIIPGWMKPQGNGKPPTGWINARSETAHEKPAFRAAYKRRRCLVPASHFYDAADLVDGSKQPYLFSRADEALMGFAGLWETWCPPDGSELDTVTILTTPPNAMMREIHERMPLILEPEEFERWMWTEPGDAATLTELLRPAADGVLLKIPVSRRVNNYRYDDAACHEPTKYGGEGLWSGLESSS